MRRRDAVAIVVGAAAGAVLLAAVSTDHRDVVSPGSRHVESRLATENPLGLPLEQRLADALRSERAAQATTRGPDEVPASVPLAAPAQAGCRTALVRNQSSRNGARPALLVLHYTVSSERPGWSDVNAIVSWFDDPRSQASSHYVIDREGHCALLVPETAKAWTQAAFNPWSISVEAIGTGREPDYLDGAGLRKLATVFADAAERWGIPVRRGAVSGCRVVRSGIVDHDQLGACGGGHHDIRPYSVDKVVAAIRAEVERRKQASRPVKLTKVERREARLRCYHRRRHLKLRKNTAAWRRELRFARYRVRRLQTLQAEIKRAAARTGWQKRDRQRRFELLARYITGSACAR